jgi:hypothetical protein
MMQVVTESCCRGCIRELQDSADIKAYMAMYVGKLLFPHMPHSCKTGRARLTGTRESAQPMKRTSGACEVAHLEKKEGSFPTDSSAHFLQCYG